MLRSLLELTLVVYCILLGRTLLLTAAVPALAGVTARPPARHDILLSLGSGWVFALAGALLLDADRQGLTRLVHGGDQQPWWLAALGFVAVLLLQDAFFYGLHRLLHQRHLYRWLHRGHHHSRHPTAWTAFAFDAGEAVLQAGFLVAVAFLIPLRPATLVALLLTMSTWAVFNHLDPAPLPAGASPGWLGRWLIGPRHHGRHHRQPRCHFGLYFTYWDRLCGTDEPLS
jgi:sterol desaturase/sphingolipid hydroxylase (fatty acid hydroxylase superfamily)